MPTTTPVRQLNEEVAQQLVDEAKRNPQMPYFGKFVGIANGQIAAVADNRNELMRLLRQAEPDPTKCFCVEVGRDYDEVHEIWGSS